MPVEPRGQAIRVMITLVNWQQEEPIGCGGGRQLSMDGTSRVTGDSHARICERLGVKFPGATRRRRVTGVPTATKGYFEAETGSILHLLERRINNLQMLVGANLSAPGPFSATC